MRRALILGTSLVAAAAFLGCSSTGDSEAFGNGRPGGHAGSSADGGGSGGSGGAAGIDGSAGNGGGGLGGGGGSGGLGGGGGSGANGGAGGSAGDASVDAPCVCTPGETTTCTDVTHIDTCKPDCTGFAPASCPFGDVCANDACIAAVCTPGQPQCLDSSTWQTCNANGTGFDPGGTCGPTEQCAGGACTSLCDLAKSHPSSVGCSFFALDMNNFNEANPDAVVVGNVSDTLTANVTLYKSPGGVETVQTATVQIPPKQLHTFFLPTEPNGTAIKAASGKTTGGAYRVASDIPVIAYLHSPLQPQATNDASLLLPEPTLTSTYVVASYIDGLGSYPSYVDIIGTADGTTVNVVPRTATNAGAGVPSISAGTKQSFTLNRYDVLQIGVAGGDVSGMIVSADHPLAVIGAVQCANIPVGYTYCDHVEEQMLPVETWGRHYVGAHIPKRSGTERYYWRVYAASDNTTITTTPSQTGFPKVLNHGEFYEFWSQQSFLIDGDQPFLAMQYMTGQDAFGAGTGDPAMITAVPVEQWLTSYVVLTPSGYTSDYLQIIRSTSDDVLVDNVAVPASEYYAIGGYQVADHKVSAGVHSLTSKSAFGIVGVGYTAVTSYGYPGGMQLQKL